MSENNKITWQKVLQAIIQAQSPPSPHWASPAAQPFLSAYDRGILPPVHRR